MRSHLVRSAATLLTGAAVLSGLAACDTTAGSDDPGTITGLVTAEGQPVEGAEVRVAGGQIPPATTDASGTFTFPEILPATYTLTLSSWPVGVTFGQTQAVVTVPRGGTTQVAFTGSFLRNASIQGAVTASGTGVAGVTVRIAGPDTRETTTGAGGSFSFTGLRVGDYTVSLEGVPADVQLDATQASVSLGVGESRTVSFAGTQLRAAEVRIERLRRPPTGLSFNLDDVDGEADVVVDLDPGTETVTEVRVLLAGVVLATETFPDGPPDEPVDLRLRINTAAVDEATGGPLFENGPQQLRVEVDSEEGGETVDSHTIQITLTNTDRIAGVQAVSVGDGVVSQGRRWYGGRDLTFEVVPVIFDPDLEIGSITLQATGDLSGNAAGSLDLGSGPGQPHTVEGPPFRFTAALADNDGVVEDDPDGDGHTLEVVEVFDADGVEITDRFIPGHTQSLEGFYVDMVAPQLAAATLAVDGSAIAAGDFYSDGDFGVNGLSELGSGGLEYEFEVEDADQAAPLTGVTSVDDLPERDNSKYTLRALSVRDAVGNEADEDDLPGDSPDFGVDRSAPTIKNPLPAEAGIYRLDGSDDDHNVIWNVSDPRLADGASGSGIDHSLTSVSVSVVGGGSSSFTISDPELTENRDGNAVDGDYALDVSGFGEEELLITVTVRDQAVDANEGRHEYGSITLDFTPPEFSNLSPVPGGTLGTDANSIIQEIGGTVEDNTLGGVQITVYSDGDDGAGSDPHDDGDPDDGVANLDNTCQEPAASGDPDERLNVDDDEIDRNDIEVFGETVSEPFKIFNPGSSTVTYCFIIRAVDGAMDNTGDLDPNSTAVSTRVNITWN